MEIILLVLEIIYVVIFAYWLLLLLASPPTRQVKKTELSVTVLIPAHNEEKRIGKTLEALRRVSYPKLEVIVLDDGSTDKTAEVVKGYGFRVLTFERMGKAAVLNEGMKLASGDVIIILDADTRPAPDAIEKIVAPFYDKDVVVVTGVLYAEGKGLLGSFQRVEYAFASEIIKAHAAHNFPPPFFFGAFLAVRRDFALKHPFDPQTLGEDIGLILDAMAEGKKIAGSHAVAHTEVPGDLISFLKQRLRWNLAGLHAVLKRPKLLPRYPVFLYVFWPLFSLLAYPQMILMFLKYIGWHLGHGTLLEYLFSWFTLYGPVNVVLHVAEWGFPPLAIIGGLLGFLAFTVIISSWIRNEPKISDLPFLFFLPVYTTFLLGALPLVAVIALPFARQRNIW